MNNIVLSWSRLDIKSLNTSKVPPGFYKIITHLRFFQHAPKNLVCIIETVGKFKGGK